MAKGGKFRENIPGKYFPFQGSRHGQADAPAHGSGGPLPPSDLGRVHDYSHFYISPDGRYIVGDECRHDNLKDNCIWLFDIKTGKEIPLCLHGASFKPRGRSTNDAHTHPAFSPAGRHMEKFLSPLKIFA